MRQCATVSLQMNPYADSPGLRVVPPVYYAIATLLGLAVQRALPVRLLPDGLTGPLAAILGLGSLALAVWSFRELVRARTTFRVDRGATALVTTGPYRRTRNPLYVSLGLLQAAIGVWLNSVWIVLLLVPTTILVTRRVIVPEEHHLAARFGEAYRTYRTRVPRWI